jgi:hypothetical protein
VCVLDRLTPQLATAVVSVEVESHNCWNVTRALKIGFSCDLDIEICQSSPTREGGFLTLRSASEDKLDL